MSESRRFTTVITRPGYRYSPDHAAPLLEVSDLVHATGPDPAAILEAAHDADALYVVTEQITKEMIQGLSRCRVIHRMGIGVDVIDVAAATNAGIWVTNVPDANYREVGVHAASMALALARRLPHWDAVVRAGQPAAGLGLTIRRAESQTAGLLGFGRTARITAGILQASGYHVIIHDPFVSRAAAAEAGVEWVGMTELLTRSNILSLHVPLTESNWHLIDADALGLMPTGAILVNCSRGGLVDEAALAGAVTSGHLAGAGIDTHEVEPVPLTSPLLGVDGILLSPHAAHWSREAMAETVEKSFAQIARILSGLPPTTAVNNPYRPQELTA
jgi:D-3-phosphoglycerate dehydrogenase